MNAKTIQRLASQAAEARRAARRATERARQLQLLAKKLEQEVEDLEAEEMIEANRDLVGCDDSLGN